MRVPLLAVALLLLTHGPVTRPGCARSCHGQGSPRRPARPAAKAKPAAARAGDRPPQSATLRPAVPAAPAADRRPPPPARPTSFPRRPPPPADPGARKTWLKARLDEIAGHSSLAGGQGLDAGLEFESGQVLYARNEKMPLNAASNVKLVTSAAALSRLGPEYRWRTVVYGPAQTGGRWLGRGRRSERRPLPARLGRSHPDDRGPGRAGHQPGRPRASSGCAAALVVDASFFDGGPVGPAYEQKTDSAAYRSPSSAASLNGNAVLVTVIPGARAGAPARITVEPSSPYFTVTGRIVTAGMTGPAIPLVDTDQLGEQTRITVSGRVRLGTEPRMFLRRVVHPELFLGHTFQRDPEEAGHHGRQAAARGPGPRRRVPHAGRP